MQGLTLLDIECTQRLRDRLRTPEAQGKVRPPASWLYCCIMQGSCWQRTRVALERRAHEWAGRPVVPGWRLSSLALHRCRRAPWAPAHSSGTPRLPS